MDIGVDYLTSSINTLHYGCAGHQFRLPLSSHDHNYQQGYCHDTYGIPYVPLPGPASARRLDHSTTANYKFQDSLCSGQNRALLVGINYFGQRGELHGCIDDIRTMSVYLQQSLGYARPDMVVLTDDQQHKLSQPSKINILRAMHWLVKDARPGDALLFHYSGHGWRLLESDESEPYFDDCLYPLDFRSAGLITGDELHRIMIEPLVPGIKLTSIIDTRHPGVLSEYPYRSSMEGIVKEHPVVRG